MVFSSTLFLFLFLPGVLTLYLLVPWRLKNFVLLCASLLFYAWGEVFYFLIMLASILLNYAFGLLVHRSSGRTAAKLAMAGGVAANLALLGYFKYANFLGANVGALLSSLGMAPLEFERVHLPIGISF
ncbi:MAG: MBOAT family protein, partial [Candidatus Hydrogenedentes bacterium]|nr:MBOAT family protein [Candidatus Hydrogenedentota bacterium]